MIDAELRDLASHRLIPRAEALAEGGVCERFSDARWEAFKRDVAAYRQRSSAYRWGLALKDHGYNGTPLTTAVLGGLAQQPWIPTPRLLGWIGWLDVALVAGLAALLAWSEGAAPSLTFLFFTLANPLNDHSFIGGSYLR